MTVEVTQRIICDGCQADTTVPATVSVDLDMSTCDFAGWHTGHIGVNRWDLCPDCIEKATRRGRSAT